MLCCAGLPWLVAWGAVSPSCMLQRPSGAVVTALCSKVLSQLGRCCVWTAASLGSPWLSGSSDGINAIKYGMWDLGACEM